MSENTSKSGKWGYVGKAPPSSSTSSTASSTSTSFRAHSTPLMPPCARPVSLRVPVPNQPQAPPTPSHTASGPKQPSAPTAPSHTASGPKHPKAPPAPSHPASEPKQPKASPVPSYTGSESDVPLPTTFRFLRWNTVTPTSAASMPGPMIKPDPDPILIVKRSSEHVVTILDDSNEMAIDPEPSGPGKHTEVQDPVTVQREGTFDSPPPTDEQMLVRFERLMDNVQDMYEDIQYLTEGLKKKMTVNKDK
ncbi:hypothetical protein V8E53_007774 [Lactarius tabidus]